MIFTPQQVKEAIDYISNVLPGSTTAHVGSSYITGDGADLDLVVLVKIKGSTEHDQLIKAGFRWTGRDEYDDDQFATFRQDHINVMLTDSREFFAKFQEAAEVCKFLHQQYGFGDKTTRIAIHRILMNEESVSEVQDYLGLAVL